MKLEIPVKVDFDDVQAMIYELKKLQTYKLFEGDDTVLVELDDVISILAKHIRETHNSSESPNSWIPVSERLPERCNYYIVTDFGAVEEAYYNSDGRWFSKDGDKLKDVTAWMPLPEPWKEAKE